MQWFHLSHKNGIGNESFLQLSKGSPALSMAVSKAVGPIQRYSRRPKHWQTSADAFQARTPHLRFLSVRSCVGKMQASRLPGRLALACTLLACLVLALLHISHITIGQEADKIALDNGIDDDMSTEVSKIFQRPTDKDDSAKTIETRETRAVKGDLMMERDLIKHMKMIRAQVTNGEPMGTKDIESQVKFLKEDLDFLLLNPESAGYTKIPYDSRKRRLELAQRIKALVDYLQYRLVTEHGCSIHAVLNEGRCMPDPLPNKLQGDWEQEMYGDNYRMYQPYYYGQGLANGAYPGGAGGGGGTKTVGTEIKANGKNSRNDFIVFGGPVSVKFPSPTVSTPYVVSGAPGAMPGLPTGSLMQPGPGIGR